MDLKSHCPGSTVGLCDPNETHIFSYHFTVSPTLQSLPKKSHNPAKPNQTNKNPEEVDFVKENEDHTSVRMLPLQDSRFPGSILEQRQLSI